MELAQELAPLITAGGVVLATWQLWLKRSLAQSSFEDGLAKEYRDLIRLIPVDVLLGRPFDRDAGGREYSELREVIFNYLDLTNEQVYLRSKGRVRRSTFSEWSVGIRSNLSRPAFTLVWNEVKQEASTVFSELQELETRDFKPVSIWWRLTHRRRALKQ